MVPIAYVGTTNVNSLALTANGAPLHIVKTKERLGKKKGRKEGGREGRNEIGR